MAEGQRPVHGWVRGQRGGGSGAPQTRVPSRCPGSRRAGTEPGPCWHRSFGAGSSGQPGAVTVSPVPQGAMGRQRAPPEPCWRRLLRSGCRWLLSLCGTTLRGLRGLWSLTWVGTTEPLPPAPPRTSAGSKSGVWPQPGLGQGCCWVQSLHCCCWRRGEPVTTTLGCGSGTLVPGAGSWLKALCGCAHQEPWGRGDTAAGSAGSAGQL